MPFTGHNTGMIFYLNCNDMFTKHFKGHKVFVTFVRDNDDVKNKVRKSVLTNFASKFGWWSRIQFLYYRTLTEPIKSDIQVSMLLCSKRTFRLMKSVQLWFHRDSNLGPLDPKSSILATTPESLTNFYINLISRSDLKNKLVPSFKSIIEPVTGIWLSLTMTNLPSVATITSSFTQCCRVQNISRTI